ncbi:hypothetical protein [Sandarakinorhabdus sp.]|uniref:hypothetical protein n=1 Tax=Sandarakinorhabdus sp. TaxID=1916663 RepID=UPI00286E7397|nr:hypothetical protein [Sandarakinorhabdus sp.]
MIVTGQRDQAEQLRARGAAYLRKTLPTTVGGQNARWNEPVCPVAVNVRAATAKLFADRVRETAMAIGAEAAKPDCRPNIAIVFAADAGAALREIGRRQPTTFDALTGPERRALFASKAPVRWWHHNRITGADGRELSGVSAALGFAGFGAGANAPVLSGTRTTRLDAPTVVGITGAVVLIDVPLASGQDLSALADYVAMIALSRVRANVADRPDDSILSLFEADPRPAALSDFDTAFLRALYSGPPNQNGLLQRSMMAGAMRDTITGAEK